MSEQRAAGPSWSESPQGAASDASDPALTLAPGVAENATTAAERGESARRRLAWRLGVSLAIAAFFVWMLHAGALPLVPERAAFAAVRWWTFGLYILGWSAVHVLRAARWKLLLAPIAEVSLRRVLVASFVGFFAILVLPLRAGEVVRPVMIREKGKLSAWAALGSLGAERIMDGLVLSGMLFVALHLADPLDPLPATLGDLPIPVAVIPKVAYAALLSFGAALLVMLAFYVWKGPARRGVEWLLQGISPRLASWAAARIEGLAQGLSFVSHWRQGLPFLLSTLVYWLLNSACAWLLGWGVGLAGFSFPEACVVTGVLALGVLVPNAPGFFGAFQFSLYAALALFFPRELVLVQGAAFVLLLYAAQTLITVAFAGWGALFSDRSARRWLRDSWLRVASICWP